VEKRLFIGVLVLAAAATLAMSSHIASGRPAGAKSNLTSQGQLLWNLEGLLRKTFGRRRVYASETLNFSCAGTCTPASRFAPYRFVFREPRTSIFRLAKRRFGDGAFGNFPIAVRIRGEAIACNGTKTQFLVEFRNAAAFTLGCLSPIH
jgi:hypothetical protein